MKIMSQPTRTSNNQLTSTVTVGTSNLDDEIVEIPAPSHKQTYIQADLPFPHGGNHHRVWAKTFRPALLSWAGSQHDPFGANGIMHNKISCHGQTTVSDQVRGSWGLGISDEITKMDFEEGSFPEGKSVT